MDIIFTISENNQISNLHRLSFYLSGKINLEEVINMLPYQILAFTIHGKYKKSYKNNKFKMSAPPWNEKFELSDRSYSVLNIQDYFEHIIKRETNCIY